MNQKYSSICLNCASFIREKSDHQFECLVCRKKHAMPPEGLPTSELISLILSNKPKEFYRGEAAETLRLSLKEIEKKIKQISFGLNNGVEEVNVFYLLI